MGRRPCRVIAACLLVLGLGGCRAATTDAQIPSDPAFFADFGGMDGITATVDALLLRLAQNERIVERFALIDVGRFRGLLIEQFCMLAGGPCEYTGASMRSAHRTQGIGADEFDLLVRDLMDAMVAVGIPPGARNRLLGRLAPMFGEIVER